MTSMIKSIRISLCPNLHFISFTYFSDWPWKIFSLSYLLYPVVAAAVSIIVGIIFSLFTCLCNPAYRNRRVPTKYVHPLVRRLCRCFMERDPDETEYWTGNAHLYSRNNGIPMNPIIIDTSAAYIQPKRESQGRINKGYIPSSRY